MRDGAELRVRRRARRAASTGRRRTGVRVELALMRPRSTSTMRSRRRARARGSARRSAARACASAQPDQDLADLLHDRRLDAFGGLVEQEHPRLRHQARVQARESAARRLTAHRRGDRAGAPAAGTAITRSIASCPARRNRRPGEAQVIQCREAGQNAAALRNVAKAAAAARMGKLARDVGAIQCNTAAGGGSNPTMVLSNVLLPMPLWPTMPSASPSCSCKSRRAAPGRDRSRRADRALTT